jgi:hypothetical protein
MAAPAGRLAKGLRLADSRPTGPNTRPRIPGRRSRRIHPHGLKPQQFGYWAKRRHRISAWPAKREQPAGSLRCPANLELIGNSGGPLPASNAAGFRLSFGVQRRTCLKFPPARSSDGRSRGPRVVHACGLGRGRANNCHRTQHQRSRAIRPHLAAGYAESLLVLAKIAS